MTGDALTDEDLAARAASGDDAAFRDLVERHRERLLAWARKRMPAALRGRVSTSDVVQECLVAAHRRLADFENRGAGSFGRWLGRFLENKVRDEVRDHLVRARRNANREVRLGSRPDARPVADPAPSPGTRAQGAEEQSLLLQAMGTLSEDHREVIHLVHECGLSAAEASVRLGRSVDATRKLYARAVASLTEAVGARRSSPP